MTGSLTNRIALNAARTAIEMIERGIQPRLEENLGAIARGLPPPHEWGPISEGEAKIGNLHRLCRMLERRA